MSESLEDQAMDGFWVIECGAGPDYWTGHHPDSWSGKIEDAVRFARWDDAEIVRSWTVKPGGKYAKSTHHTFVAKSP